MFIPWAVSLNSLLYYSAVVTESAGDTDDPLANPLRTRTLTTTGENIRSY